MIRNLFKSVVHIAVASSLFYASALFAQALPAGVTPQMAQQFQNMSPAQQQALAKQYGIELPGSNSDSGSGESSLGDVGQQLEQMGLSEEEYIEDELEDVADEGVAAQLLERYGVSLFDRDVSTFAPTCDA